MIGTKAQYIKTAPLLRLLQARGIPYRLIDTGQHAVLTPRLREELGIKEPDFQFASPGNVKSTWEALRWAASIFRTIVLHPNYLKTRVFQSGTGFCVIHGDTPSTLLAALMAMRAGKTIVHIEAGLRSFNLLRPFPEEIIRIICMRTADLLFAPSAWAMENLKAMGVRGRCVQLTQNTNVEALYDALDRVDRIALPKPPYALMTLHRVETIFSRKRLEFVTNVAREIARNRKVFFVLHDPTIKKLHDFDLMRNLESADGITTLPLQDHSRFLAIMESADFIITDGGSIQEEAFYLDVPCLVMRTETERTEGIGNNVRLGQFDRPTIQAFSRDFQTLKRGIRVCNERPSEVILKVLVESDPATGLSEPLR